jgi:hypothetical protein
VSEQPYPVYEKNGMTQIAASPAREIELRYAGWRKREDPAKQPAPADSGTPGDQGDAAVPPAQPKPKPRNKPADQ